MYTLYDYLTRVKGVEYIISLLFIAGYILYAEILKPKPFKTVTETAKEDLEFIKKAGYKNVLKTLGRIVAAPFIGLAYVVALPFAFMFAIGTAALHGIFSLVHGSIPFGWRPLEAYLTGKKKKREEKKKDESQDEEAKLKERKR
jgi:4-hydroxybenzoate polyprenyltransferase